jgi:L-methionine (R)-S-oxide reductase
MRRCIDLLWGAVGSSGISWIGFYERSSPTEMTLVCREPKPACSPIGLHGMCGRGMLERRPIVIRDVRTLGPNYIACDPKDQSELVIPLIAHDGSCDAVLDVDSWDLASFDDRDAAGMNDVLLALGLTDAPSDARSLHL